MSGICCWRGPGIQDTADSYEVQVVNSEGKKWIKSSPSPAVPVKESDDVEFLNLENNPDDRTQWSFSIISKSNKKLYVTYNSEDPNDEKVRLEKACNHNTKTKYFKAFVQASGRVLLTSTTSDDRILWIKDGELAMLVVDNFQNKDWYISPTPETFTQVDIKYRVEIKDPNDSLYWKADDPIAGNSVELWDSQDVWESIIYPTGCSFMPDSECYASCKADSDVDILLGTSVTEADLRKFTMSGFSGIMLKSVYNQRYVSVDRNPRRPILRLEKDETHAVGWYLTVVGFIFVLEDGSELHFPPLRTTQVKAAK